MPPRSHKSISDVKALFARRLKAWRKSCRLPLKRVALDLGLSESALCQWENGLTFPSAEHLTLIAQYADLPPCHFFCPDSHSRYCLVTLKPNRKLPERITTAPRTMVLASPDCPL